MQAEYETRANTSANNLELFKNQVVRLGVTIGSVLLPPLNAVIGVMGSVVDVAANVAQTYPVATKVIIGVAMGLAIMKVSAIAGGYAWTFLQGSWLSGVKTLRTLQTAITLSTLKLNTFNVTAATTAARTKVLGAGGGFLVFSNKLKMLGTVAMGFASTALPAIVVGIKAMGIALMTTPIGWAIGAIAIGALAIIKFWQPVKAFFGGMWDGFAEGIKPVLVSLKPVGQLLGWIGGKIGSLIGWFGGLLSPVDVSAEKLEGFASVGKTIGSVFAGLVNVVTAPFRAAIWLIEKSVSAVKSMGSFFGIGNDEEETSKAITKPVAKSILKPVALASALAVPATQALTQPTQTATPTLPAVQAQKAALEQQQISLPQLQTQQVKQSSSQAQHIEYHTWHVTITQQPGENQQQLVDKLMKEIDKRTAQKRRGNLHDDE